MSDDLHEERVLEEEQGQEQEDVYYYSDDDDDDNTDDDMEDEEETQEMLPRKPRRRSSLMDLDDEVFHVNDIPPAERGEYLEGPISNDDEEVERTIGDQLGQNYIGGDSQTY